MAEPAPVERAIPMGRECETKAEFTELLRWWLENTTEDTIGDGGAFRGKAWIWVRAGGERCHLNADSTRKGMTRYLELARELGPGFPWHVIANNRGRVNKVVIEPDKTPTPGLFLYVETELQSPATL
jgi:hypothetical protein